MKCSRCESEVFVSLGGNCPACLLQGAVCDSFERTPVAMLDPEVGDEKPARAAILEIGEYEILEEIGRGGAGVVYRARHRRLKRLVALKVLQGGVFGRADVFERFRIEAQAAARLDHPNIVPLYETGSEGGVHYLTLRYFERGSLARELARRQFTLEAAARLIVTAARAVQFAHNRGVLHRDLKPSNLLLDESGQVHIADFGLAKLSDEDLSLTLSSSVLGTPNYMAPEQAEGRAKESTVAVDVYGLGAILFEMLTSRPPFVGESPLSILRKVADEEPPRPRALNPALDRDLEAICLRCLEKEPERRYASAASLADDLERWLGGEPISVRSVTGVERSLKWVRRRPLVAGLGMFAVLALAFGLAGTTWQWSLARKAADAARGQAYLSDMDLVHRLHEQQPQQAREILERHIPKNGEHDLRDWEWRYFWQLCQGDQPEKAWTGTKSMFSIAISDDGKLVAAGEFNGGAKIFDTDRLELVYASAEDANTNTAPFMPSGNRMGAVVIFIPGTRLFAWSETRGESNCVVQFWDSDKRKIVRSWPQPYIVRNMVPTADGARLIVSYQTPDGRTVVWNMTTEQPVAEVPKGNGYSNYSTAKVLAVSPDGKWMTYDEFPDFVRVVEVESGKDVWRFPLPDQYCLACEFSPDGRTLAVYGGFKGSSPQLWDLQTGQRVRELQPLAGWMSRLRFSRDGKLLYGSGSGSTVNLWNLTTSELHRQIRVVLPKVYDFAISPDENALFTVSETQLARWNLRKNSNGAKKAMQATLPIAKSWRFTPDGKSILGVTTNRTIALYGGRDWSEVQEFSSGATNAVTLDLLPDNSGYLVGDQAGGISVRRWNDHTLGKVVGRMDGQVSYLALDPKTGNAVAGDALSYVVWNIPSAKALASFPARQVQGSADILPGKGRWTLLEYTGDLTHVDLVTGEITRRKLPYAEAEGFSYSPSGEFAVTTGATSPVRIYRAEDWRFLRQIEARTGFYACFSPNGRRIATAHSASEAVRLWDVGTGRKICALPSNLDLAQETRFSPDGNAIAQAGSVVRAISVWWAPSWDELGREDVR